MRKIVLSISLGAVAVALAVTPALAKPDQIPVPGEPNCFGKMVSMHAREHKGLGKWIIKVLGLDVQTKLDEFREYCDGDVAPSPSPTAEPTVSPTPEPTVEPTPEPSPTPEPTFDPGGGF